MLNHSVKMFLQYLLPQHALSHLIGMVAECKTPWLKNWLIDRFVAHYQVNMQEALQSDPHAYSNFNQFFTRPLHSNARQIASETHAIISPVDGVISEFGAIEKGQLLQAKNSYYGVNDLLGGLKADAAAFQNGSFVTCYLAPKDYHRVHMPYPGKLLRMIHVPGQLFSVNPATVRQRSQLFARNERVVAFFQTELGLMAVVFVGAMIVASVSTVWSGLIKRPSKKQIQRWDYADKNLSFNRGEELGHFQLGSTIIVLFPANSVSWQPELETGKTLRLGEMIAAAMTP